MLNSSNYHVVFMCVVVVFCFDHSLSAATNNDDLICLMVEISGATTQPQCNGRYLIDKSFERHCSGRQAWARNDDQSKPETGTNGTFLYYLEDGYDGWVVAKASCLSWGNFMSMVKTDSQTPFKMAEIWSEYSDTSGKLLENSQMKVECVERALDYCSSSPCSSGSECVNGVDGFTCKCDEHHSGPRCIEVIAAAHTFIVTRTLSQRIVQTIAISCTVVFGIVAIAVIAIWVFLRKRIERRERESENATGDGRRNIYVGGSSSQQYKLLEETSAPENPASTERLFVKF